MHMNGARLFPAKVSVSTDGMCLLAAMGGKRSLAIQRAILRADKASAAHVIMLGKVRGNNGVKRVVAIDILEPEETSGFPPVLTTFRVEGAVDDMRFLGRFEACRRAKSLFCGLK